MLKNLVNPDAHQSFSNSLRRRRFQLFLPLIERAEEQVVRILDVGGTEIFWETMDFGVKHDGDKAFEITLLNLEAFPVKYKNFKSVKGDARNMREFKNQEFDIVFSNSVIEHVGTFADQALMASEIRRVGRQYYVQTPNYYFPIEPHFLFPFFQFLPIPFRAAMINRFNLGNTKRIPDASAAIEYVKSLQLLSHRELAELFPDAKIHREKFSGLTKSFICIRG